MKAKRCYWLLSSPQEDFALNKKSQNGGIGFQRIQSNLFLPLERTAKSLVMNILDEMRGPCMTGPLRPWGRSLMRSMIKNLAFLIHSGYILFSLGYHEKLSLKVIFF